MAGVSKILLYLTFSFGIFYADVGFPEWKRIPEVSGSTCILSFDNIILAGSNKGVYRSTDNALTWVHYSVDYPSKGVNDLTGNNKYIFAATNEGVYSSSDTGKTWNPLGPSYSILSVFAVDSIVFACIHGGGLFRSDDNGKQWTAIDGNHFYSYLVYDSRILAGTFTGVYESSDMGSNWHNKALPNKITTSLSKNNKYFFAANYTFGIFRSSDEGTTWSEFNDGIPIDKYFPYTVFAADSLIFAGCSSNKIFISTNNGINWEDYSEGINISENTYNVKFAKSGDKILVSFLNNGLWTSNLSELTGLTERPNNSPDNFILFQNYPNPFNSVSIICYLVPKPCYVTIKIYDLLGKEKAVLVDEEKPAGNYQITYDAQNTPSGVYFYTMHAGNFKDIKKFILLK